VCLRRPRRARHHQPDPGGCGPGALAVPPTSHRCLRGDNNAAAPLAVLAVLLSKLLGRGRRRIFALLRCRRRCRCGRRKKRNPLAQSLALPLRLCVQEAWRCMWCVATLLTATTPALSSLAGQSVVRAWQGLCARRRGVHARAGIVRYYCVFFVLFHFLSMSVSSLPSASLSTHHPGGVVESSRATTRIMRDQ
jgi:hypothetical protein